jgi:hypothetical protein
VRTGSETIDFKGWISSEQVNWFTSKEEKGEKEFKISDESQVEYAFELVKQSYNIVKKREFDNRSAKA